MISRRDFGKLALVSVATVAKSAINSTIRGVRIGASGYSFQALPLDEAIAAMQRIGLGFGEVWFRHIEPKLAREALRDWRLSVSLDEYRKVGEKYRAAGIEIVAFTFDIKEDFSDAEMERGFEMARALGSVRIATSTTFRMAQRLLPFMEKYRIEVAFHGHTNASDPNEFAGPDSFRKVLQMSPYARINLDIGQFVAAGFDPVPFIREQHENIPFMHVRDGDPRAGTKLAWGAGATPIREVLQLLKGEHYPIVADIEYDYNGGQNPEAEIGKCFAYCRKALGEGPA